MNSGQGSLRRRLLVAAVIVVVIALVAAGVSIGFVLHRFVRGQVDGRLDDRILSLVSDLQRSPGSALSLGRDIDGPPFERPGSGWYWQIRRGRETVRSASLDGQDLTPPDKAPRARSDGEIRPADGTGPRGESLILRILVVAPTPGREPTTIIASAPQAALRGPVLEAFGMLAACLAAIGLFLVAGAVVQVRLGLRPLVALKEQLAEVRGGRRGRLPDRQPEEVRPLVEEMNALLDQNAAQLEGARAHVANLAHGLKTPLATLSLALAERGGASDPLLRLAEAMDRRVRHHLRRARAAAAAVAGPARSRADLSTHVADLRGALLRIHAGKDLTIAVDTPDGLAVACDPQDLDEMLGNLIENACRWCRREVRIAATQAGQRADIVIEDDGPGLPPEQVEAVMQRGRRLDESLPGHGFGLPIAAELAGLYGGSLGLGRGALGGLQVRLSLPRS